MQVAPVNEIVCLISCFNYFTSANYSIFLAVTNIINFRNDEFATMTMQFVWGKNSVGFAYKM